MKKKSWIFLALILLALTAYYLLIPSSQNFTVTIAARANQHPAYRALIDDSSWKLWWPGNHDKNKLMLGAVRYTEGRQQFNSQEVLLSAAGFDSLSSEIIIVPIDFDSIQIGWQLNWKNSMNPFKRYNDFSTGKALAANMQTILNAFKGYISKKENLYSFDIRESKVKDTVMIATKGTTTGWPPVAHTYSLIRKLQEHIAKQGATAVNYPMMHVSDLGNNVYETQVAIPVNRTLPETKDIFIKRMILGNILEAEVKGGYIRINAGLKMMDLYIKDYGKTPPAIPFQLIITDRLAEPDSSKWVTRLYYPVF